MNKQMYILILICMMVAGCAQTQNKSAPDLSQPPPKLLKPEVRKIWMPAIIKNGGTEWEEGHYLYRIEKDTTWSR